MTINEDTRKTIRSLKYRTQELDSKLQAASPDVDEIKTMITEIKALANKLGI
jgi:hypothetical protein